MQTFKKRLYSLFLAVAFSILGHPAQADERYLSGSLNYQFCVYPSGTYKATAFVPLVQNPLGVSIPGYTVKFVISDAPLSRGKFKLITLASRNLGTAPAYGYMQNFTFSGTGRIRLTSGTYYLSFLVTDSSGKIRYRYTFSKKVIVQGGKAFLRRLRERAET